MRCSGSPSPSTSSNSIATVVSTRVLTPGRAELVSGERLARWAAELDLGALLRLGRGEDQTGGRARESILATALEAVLGVVYLESGLDAARRVVARLAAW